MTVNDPIADMLTRIRNANNGFKDSVEMPASKMKVEIAKLLKEEGYITDYALLRGESFRQHRRRSQVRQGRQKVISGLRRISKPGRRVYTQQGRHTQGAWRAGNGCAVHIDRTDDRP